MDACKPVLAWPMPTTRLNHVNTLCRRRGVTPGKAMVAAVSGLAIDGFDL
ncbi:hypothetical protein EHW99_3656 [Erwinia amylovora]|uniref:Uncharacterized protein n=3 Tax=Erwinia amylovora TaxID=552 RepID=A0A831A8R3_ERWAM|nr:hypothetical protein EaACW_3735 [Erwinia amylovora ACW56400]QJQ56355.1 hypothetical protein EHX00_3656 [Erwinia amylovora]CBA24194.1 hypothetical protein predicted by Glimmer/Critica [Erwinia amylovora CFBP1430]CBX82593.1 hypothetical protein predicted by Glimmer/Critica [Erwinia amylovora ATCC BAA-2158]CCO80568.1 hypothetical protein BN432_3801 [Erwinia amylovora Ea356]CCO84381.1 hypothetical protein BN433_3837 [Erwinia amylovora Ea266]CCO88134.1 hypothetical protein BN434_3777 [Erwinia a